jgi:RNA polymerase sigma-70 factor (ECF subfamily)
MTMADPKREGEAAALLVARAKAGDASAFEALVRRYRKRIYALALHLTGSGSDADDITQDVFLRAYRALDGFEGRSEFFTWVYRMTVNRSLNARRDRERRGEEPMDDLRVELAINIDARGNPAIEADLRQTYTRLVRALDALPVEMRTSVVLVALQGLSHGEAAVVQKCSDGTIAWRIHEARRRLHESMRPEQIKRRRPLSAELSRLLADAGLPILATKPN